MPNQKKTTNNLSIILITIVTTVVTVVVIAILVAIQFSSQIGELFQGTLRPMTLNTQSYQAPTDTGAISDVAPSTSTESVTPGATLDYLSMIRDLQNEVKSLKENNQQTQTTIQTIQSMTTSHTSKIENLTQKISTANIIINNQLNYFCGIIDSSGILKGPNNCLENYNYLFETTGLLPDVKEKLTD